jgi:hypothetical protein
MLVIGYVTLLPQLYKLVLYSFKLEGDSECRIVGLNDAEGNGCNSLLRTIPEFSWWC